MAQEPEYGRRGFIKESVLSLARTAQEYVTHRDAPREEAVVQTFRADGLRPPGAVEESLFLERCTKCGDCVKACPYGSITLSQRDGTPEIFPDQHPCYLCHDFPCIASCGTEALIPVDGPEEVKLGVAEVLHRVCTAGQGCHACVSQCPMDALSMNFGTLRLHVAPERCVGCGICEHTCKTVNDKIAIKVKHPPLLPS